MNFDISHLLEHWDYQPGQIVVRRFSGKGQPPQHVQWDGKDAYGRPVEGLVAVVNMNIRQVIDVQDPRLRQRHDHDVHLRPRPVRRHAGRDADRDRPW